MENVNHPLTQPDPDNFMNLELYKRAKSNLLCQLCERFGPCQVCEPVVNGALRPCCDEPKIVLLINLWLPLACVGECVASQLLCNDAAEI